jgi:DUF1680 family protein
MSSGLLSRRRLLAHGSVLACACHTSLLSQAFAGAPSARLVESRLREFRHGRVQLDAGPLRSQFDQQQQLFLSLSDDALLKPFRLRAGQDAPGPDMGGWYDQSSDFHIDPNDWGNANWHGFIPGHSFGQYVSGLARGYAVTGDEAAKKKVLGLVEKFALTISPRFFEDYNLPAYTYDKLVVGLIDAFEYVGAAEAKDALDKLTDVALPFLPEKALTREERRARPYKREAQIWDEPYTLPENLFLAWQRGMGERYKALALRYLQDDALFGPLARGQSPLKGKHAYSHVNALCSAIQAYLSTGESRYLDAARNGFAFVQAQSYATGGWGPNEELLGPDDSESLQKMLEFTHRSFETPCGAYAHFKVTRALLGITTDSRYGDSMERILYNTILGAKPTLPDGSTFYYSDYNEQASKFYRGEQWPCCSGTFIQLTADYGISAYLFDERNVYVNLYVPSTVKADFAGSQVSITQASEYPFGNDIRLRIDVAKPTSFGLRLRIPAWAGRVTRIRINGKDQRSAVEPSTFATVSRTWRPGDSVELQLDMGLRLEQLNDAHPDLVALMTGPLALFPIGAGATQPTRRELLAAARSGPDEWTVMMDGARMKLKPFMSIADEGYRLYNRLRAT